MFKARVSKMMTNWVCTSRSVMCLLRRFWRMWCLKLGCKLNLHFSETSERIHCSTRYTVYRYRSLGETYGPYLEDKGMNTATSHSSETYLSNYTA